MIEYLTKYNLNNDDINELKLRFNKDIISKFEIMETTVTKVLDYFKEMGITNYLPLILNRPDLCFSDIDNLKEKIEKIDQNLIKYIIENDPQNLISLDI